MINLPVWDECRKCACFKPEAAPTVTAALNAFSQADSQFLRCQDPFPASGECSLADQRVDTFKHNYQRGTVSAHLYASLLDVDARLASIFLRWRLGDYPNDADFIYLREQILAPGHFMKEDKPLQLLQELMGNELLDMVNCFAIYNLKSGKPLHEGSLIDHTDANYLHLVYLKALGALTAAVFGTLPHVFFESEELAGCTWLRLIMEQVRYILWESHGCKHVDLSALNDKQFREEFQQEWKVLMAYEDAFYGFRVIPRLSFNDIVRYETIYRGDLSIRRAISVYLTHQATEYPHWAKDLTTNFAEEAFEGRIRQIYERKIKSLARRALKNEGFLEGEVSDMHVEREKLLHDLEEELWRQFKLGREKYEFYWDYGDKQRPFGKSGYVGFPQDVETRELLEQMLKEHEMPFRLKDTCEVGFTHYINRRLDRWVKTNYPPDVTHRNEVSLETSITGGIGATLGDTLSGEKSWNPDDTQFPAPDKIFRSKGEGELKAEYITIKTGALRWALTEDQLRYMERQGSVPALRVRDVDLEDNNLSADVRLYPFTPEFDAIIVIAKARLDKRSSRLQGQEVDRKSAALMLGTSISKLRKWEDAHLIDIQRKGKIVVYGELAIEQARKLVAESRLSKGATR